MEGTQPLSAGMLLIFLQLEKRSWEHGQMICAAEVSEELSQLPRHLTELID